jgi:uncharacterized lipoprotein YmbA
MLARLVLLPVLLLALAACSHSPPQRYYVLPGPAATPATLERNGPLIGLGPVNLPAYLDRPQIVTRASDSRLDLASGQRWAEPFADSFRRALQAQLANAVPSIRVLAYPWKPSLPIARRISVEVLRFDRGADGAVVLTANWSVASGGDIEEAVQHTSQISVPQAGKAEDYDRLVAAHGEAIAALARAIAAALAL